MRTGTWSVRPSGLERALTLAETVTAMDTAILVIWWVGLIVALGVTLVILKQVALVLGTLTGIHRLALITRDAARGMAVNMTATSTIPALEPTTREMAEAVKRIAGVAASLEEKLERVTGGGTKGR
jgi:hypothetical protein